MTDTRRTRLAVAAAAVVAWLLCRRYRRDTADGVGDGDGVLDAAGVRRLYDRIAPVYDIAASPYNLIGARRLAKRAISHGGVVYLAAGTANRCVAV